MNEPTRVRRARTLHILCLLATVPALVACSGDEGGSEEGQSTAAPASAPVEKAPPAQAQPQPPAPVSPDGGRQSADVGGLSAKGAPPVTSPGEGVIPAGDLRDAYYHWNGERVEIAAYPALFTSRSRWKERMDLGMGNEAKAPALARCEFASVPEGNIEAGTPLVVRATIKRRYFAVRDGEPPKIDLGDCELVSVGEPFPESLGSAWDLGSGTLAIDDLHDALFGWLGKTVKVSGYFWGSTYSSANDTTVHSLKAGVKGAKAVGCNQAGKTSAPEAVSRNREGTIVEGTIAQSHRDSVTLEDCRFQT